LLAEGVAEVVELAGHPCVGRVSHARPPCGYR